MRFRDWMDACLYDEQDGYYMRPGRKTGAGDDADFATAPTLHPFMAESVAKQIQATWEDLGNPDDFSVVEFGGGEGDLARDALMALEAAAPGLAAVLEWTHVEASPTHRGKQAGHERIRWSDRMPDAFTGVVLAHEFVDALPVHVLEQNKGNWGELMVDWDEDGQRFVESLGIPARRAIEAAPKRLVEDGQRVTAMADARAWMTETGHAIDRGAVMIIDYGDRGKRLWVPDRPDATVRGYRRQELVEDVLADPGEVDITSSVDFTQLREWAMGAGLREASFETQESFLVRHGALEALAQAPRDTVEDASRYLRLKQLVMPQAMGSAFKVQVLVKGEA